MTTFPILLAVDAAKFGDLSDCCYDTRGCCSCPDTSRYVPETVVLINSRARRTGVLTVENAVEAYDLYTAVTVGAFRGFEPAVAASLAEQVKDAAAECAGADKGKWDDAIEEAYWKKLDELAA